MDFENSNSYGHGSSRTTYYKNLKKEKMLKESAKNTLTLDKYFKPMTSFANETIITDRLSPSNSDCSSDESIEVNLVDEEYNENEVTQYKNMTIEEALVNLEASLKSDAIYSRDKL